MSDSRANVAADLAILTDAGIPQSVAVGFMHGVIAAVEVFERYDGEKYNARTVFHEATARILAKWATRPGQPPAGT